MELGPLTTLRHGVNTRASSFSSHFPLSCGFIILLKRKHFLGSMHHCHFVSWLQWNLRMFLPSLTSHQEFSGCQLVFSAALSASVPLRSSLITDDKASGLIPCSQSRTQIDSVSISKPVFKILEISSSTKVLCDIWMKALLRWEAPLAHKLFDPLSIRPQALWTKVYRGILAQHTDDASPSLRADGAFLPDNWQSSTLPQNPPDPTMVPFCSSLVGKTSFSSMETS